MSSVALAQPPAPQFLRLNVEPYTPNIGAVIHDLDLSKPLDESTAAELSLALAHHQVLFFRDQQLTPAQQVKVAEIFGSPEKAKAYFPRSAEHELVEVIESRPEGPRYTTEQWHSDVSYLAVPPAGAVLYAQLLPPSGGDTLWSSAHAVFESLPAGLAKDLEHLTATHSIEKSGWGAVLRAQLDGDTRYQKILAEQPPRRHPLVQTHPVTGRKFIFANPKYTSAINDLSRQDSDDLLKLLFARFERPEYQARLRWQLGTLAIWDNLTTQHAAVADYQPAVRRMHRVTF